MNIGAYDFDSIGKLVRDLQAENRKLRALLNKAAIPYSESEVFSDALSAAEYDLEPESVSNILAQIWQPDFSPCFGRERCICKKS